MQDKRSIALVGMTVMGSVESITLEVFFIITHIQTVVITMVSTPIAGVMILLLYHGFVMKKGITVLRSWRLLLMIGALGAVTNFTWFDAVGRVGAAKTTLMSIPLEIILIVVLSSLILSEHLRRIQIIGAAIVVGGVILSLVSDQDEENVIKTQFGIGEIEVIITSFCSAVETIFITKLVQRHDPLQVSAFILIIAGIVVNINWLFIDSNQITSSSSSSSSSTVIIWLYLLLIAPLIPVILTTCSFTSYRNVGASLTTIVWSCTVILTIVLSLVLVTFGIPLTVPENVTLALIGGAVSLSGIGVIFSKR